jgi:Na+-translocating ferredoxin:NAD+ oxidoreductase subunit G
MGAKKESSFKNMVITLAIIPGLASLALGAVYVATKDRIAEAKEQKLNQAISMVLPAFGRTETYSLMPVDGKDSLTCYAAYSGDSLVGTAVKTYTDIGFSGRFLVMAGFLPDGTINNAMILEHKETPGLGDKMEQKKSPWANQFSGKHPSSFSIKVKKDGGDVDAITAATISSRAFCDAVNRASQSLSKEGGQQ